MVARAWVGGKPGRAICRLPGVTSHLSQVPGGLGLLSCLFIRVEASGAIWNMGEVAGDQEEVGIRRWGGGTGREDEEGGDGWQDAWAGRGKVQYIR